MNRIQDAIDQLATKIEGMNGVGLNGTPLSEMIKGQALSSEEFSAYQNLQSKAHAMGQLTTDEAQTIYIALGGEMHSQSNYGWPENTGLATMVIVTQALGEMVGVDVIGS